MATLRYLMSRSLLPLSIVIVIAACVHAADGEPANPPAALQLPGWLQSLRVPPPSEQAATTDADAEAEAEADDSSVVPAAGIEPATPRVRQVADWSDPRPPTPPTVAAA